MNAESLEALAERVEAATGPDRELDGSIWWATRSPDEIEHLDRTGFVRECIKRDGSAGKALAQFYDSANPACLAKIAFQMAYTSSLDAAMTTAEGSGRTVANLLSEAMIRLQALPLHLLAAIEYREALARYFTAASLRARASILRSEA